jgi:chemotaxis protein CheZ
MTTPDPDAVRNTVREELAAQFADMRRFVDRRIAELSAEVHGATQLLGFSESNLSNQLGMIQEEMGRMLARPAEASRNSGLELEAVLLTTENAANQIMEAAEAISDTLRATLPDKQALQAITSKIDAIFEACAFQDLTGQRVRRAIEHLQHMESALNNILAPPGAEVEIKHPSPPTVRSTGADLPQDDIDALFAA